MVDTEHPYTKLINEAISDNTVKTIGFEDDTLTVEEYTLYNTKLNAVLHPYAAEINASARKQGAVGDRIYEKGAGDHRPHVRPIC